MLKTENKTPVTVDNTSGRLDPTPSSRKIRLKNLEDVRREQANLYREARTRKIEVNEASKLSYMLTNIAKMIEAENEIEKASINPNLDDEARAEELARKLEAIAEAETKGAKALLMEKLQKLNSTVN